MLYLHGYDVRVHLHDGGRVTFVERSLDTDPSPLTPANCPKSRWTQSGTKVVFDCGGVTMWELQIDQEGSFMRGTWHLAARPNDRRPVILTREPTCL